MQYLTDNTRITGLMEVSPPNEIITELPISADSSELVFKSRKEISDILHGRDDRLVVVVGPCSIHDPESALEYAKRLKSLETKHSDQLKIEEKMNNIKNVSLKNSLSNLLKAFNENNKKLLKIEKELQDTKEKFLTEEEKILNLLD